MEVREVKDQNIVSGSLLLAEQEGLAFRVRSLVSKKAMEKVRGTIRSSEAQEKTRKAKYQ